MKIKNIFPKILVGILIAFLLINVVNAEDKKHLFVVDDQSPASDVTLMIDLTNELKAEGIMTEEDYQWPILLNSKVTKDDLADRVTVFIYNGQAKIIVGDTSPAEHVILATKISGVLKDKFGIDPGVVLLSSEVKYDDLKKLFDEEQPTCTDTDGGRNYYVRGTVKGLEAPSVWDKWTDYCGVADEEEGNLVEYICSSDGYVEKDIYTCPYGCKDGACIDIDLIRSYDFKDVLQEGETKLYTVNNIEYEITVEFQDSKVQFRVNGEVTSKLSIREIYTLTPGEKIQPLEIIGEEEAGELTKNAVEFVFKGREHVPIISYDLKGVLQEGETKIYTVNTVEYEITVEYIGDSNVKFKVNGEITSKLSIREVYTLTYGEKIQPLEIIGEEEAGELTKNAVEFVFKGREEEVIILPPQTTPVTLPVDLKYYPDLFIKNGRFNAVIVVGDTAPSEDVVAAIDISSSLSRKITVGAAKLVSEISDPLNTNLIVVGNPCNNAIAAQLMGDPRPCLKYFKEGQGMIKLFENNGYVQLLVAGYSNEDTRKAAKVLKNWEDYDLKGTEVTVTGTLASPVIGIPEEPTITPEPTIVPPERPMPVVPISPVVPTPTVVPVTKEVCNGCLADDTCLPFGTRLVEEDIPKYCDITKKLVPQKEKGEACQNNYECKTNQCSDGICSSLIEELRETRSLLQRILDWIKSIFG